MLRLVDALPAGIWRVSEKVCRRHDHKGAKKCRGMGGLNICMCGINGLPLLIRLDLLR